MAKCKICGEKFKRRNKNHKFCSGGCRQKDYRKRHGISTPFDSKLNSKMQSVRNFIGSHQGFIEIKLKNGLDKPTIKEKSFLLEEEIKGDKVETILKLEEQFLETESHIKAVFNLKRDIEKNINHCHFLLGQSRHYDERKEIEEEIKEWKLKGKMANDEVFNNFKFRRDIIKQMVEEISNKKSVTANNS